MLQGITWEIGAAITLVTASRVAWIAMRPLPHDVQDAIMFGLKRIRTVLKRQDIVGGSAPYGILWYAMNIPIGRLVGYDGRKWMISLALADSIFLWLSQTMGFLGFAAYLFIGSFQLLRAPWNVTINWLIILGAFYWWFLLIAAIAKLPVGLPLHAFGDTGRGLFYKHNYVYYGLLGTLWLLVLFSLVAPPIFPWFVFVSGFAWTILLGYLYLAKSSATPK